MKKIKVRFERDGALSNVEVVVRAPERDAEAEEVIRRISDLGSRKITVSDGMGNTCVLAEDEIISVSVRGKQLKIVSDSGNYYSQTALQHLERELDEFKFVRISRYEIVNIDKIRKFDFTLGGTLRIELEKGLTTWASRRCIPVIRKKFYGKE
ncbi:MAG: LytTR family transcriptional regulator DNA-binding domain-containing protein [Clostridiales bacterium]|nr:LytTR family transcriptional regulator DNA-binding domain-containing protein [Clostridiales bacterium]